MAKSKIRAGHYTPVLPTGQLQIMQIRVIVLATSVAYCCPDSHDKQQTRNKYQVCDLRTNLVMQHYQTDKCKLGNVNKITCLMYKVNLVFELLSLDLVWGRW